MSVIMRGLQPIYRCKHCHQYPTVSTTPEKSSSWLGQVIDVYNIHVHCPSDPSLGYSYKGMSKAYTAQHVFYVWNNTYGVKP